MNELMHHEVFISYRRSQLKLVEPLLKELENRDISYFIDKEGMNIGEDYQETLSKAIKSSKVFLLFWTSDAGDSREIGREVHIAYASEKKIVPYKIGDFNPLDHDKLSYALSGLHRVEYAEQTPESIYEVVDYIDNFLHPKLKLSPGKQAGEKITVSYKGVEFSFRWCPAGSFVMGSPDSEEGRGNDEKQHKVTLTKGFWMMETEVTQKQWKTVMETNPSNHIGDDYPVEFVTWDECQKFCRRIGLELPTEAQWEYACRAGSTGMYAGKLENIAWYESNSDKETHPVGMKKPNKWGLYDMHGLLWEWCADWYGEYPNDGVTDPVGPSTGTCRVRRGGGAGSKAESCRSTIRRYESPGNRRFFIGFRCVKVQ